MSDFCKDCGKPVIAGMDLCDECLGLFDDGDYDQVEEVYFGEDSGNFGVIGEEPYTEAQQLLDSLLFGSPPDNGGFDGDRDFFGDEE